MTNKSYKTNRSHRSNRSYKSYFFWSALVVLAVLLPIAYIMLVKPATLKAAWWDGGFRYRTAYAFTATSAIAAERKVKVDVDTATLITATKMQSDCDDVRFTDANGQLLDFFIDTNTADCNNASTDFYVKLKDIKVGGNLVYLYYGNANALRTEPGGRKNDFFDEKGLSTALKGYWKMNESAANTCDGGANDSCDSALANDGAWNGDATTTTTAQLGGRSTTYDGSGDYTSVVDSTSLRPTTITMSAWIKPGAQGTYTRILSKGNTATRDYSIGKQNTTAAFFYYAGGGDAGLNLWQTSSAWTTLFPTDTWAHVVVTYTSGDASSIRFYVNGVSKAGSWTSGAGTSAMVFTSDPLRIGASFYSTLTEYFTGNIDDVRIYGRTLSSSDVTFLYQGGRGAELATPVTFTPSSGPTASTEETTPGPIAYWKFDEGQGQGVQDQTTHRNNGTLGATSSSSSDDPTWVEEGRCVSGKCLQFDGTNDIGTIPHNAILDSYPLTVQAWVKTSDTDNYPAIVNKYLGSSLNGYQVYMEGGRVRAWYFKDSSNYVWAGSGFGLNGGSIADNRWHFITFTVDSSGGKLYVDNVLKESRAWTGTAGATTSTQDVSIGYYPGSGGTSINGFIDEVKIYPYARSVAEIKADYSAGAAVLGAADQKDYLSDGLVGYWKMDETAANGCTGGANDSCDSSGNGFDAAWNGGVTTTTGKFGAGSIFDGSGDYMTVPDNSTLDLATNMSFSAWIKTSASCTFCGLIYHDIVYLAVVSNRVGWYSDGWRAGTTTVTTGNWTHIATTYSSTTRELKFYVNGQLDKTDTNVGPPSASANPIGIGANYVGADPYTGSLDELRAYNRVLSDDDIRNLYNWAPGPVGYWNFDEGSGQSPADLSGNAYTTTLGNTSSASTDDPTWTDGKFGKALNFDGSNDYVKSGDTTTFKWMHGAEDTTNFQFTAESWVKIGTTPSPWYVILATNAFDGATTGVWMDITSTFAVEAYITAISTINDPLGGHSSGAGTYPSDGKWHHVAWTFDHGLASANSKIYIDGKLVSTANKAASSSPSTGNSHHALAIGNQNITSGQGPMKGNIDEVRIYKYVRSNQQIVEDMNANHPTGGSPVGSQLAYWSLDEQQGQSAGNRIANSPSGTLGANNSSGSDDPTWKTKTDCKVNGCLSFDGSADFVDAGDMTQTEGASQLTWSFWVKPTTLTTIDCIVCKINGSSNTQLSWGIETGLTASKIIAGIPTTSTDGDTYGETTNSVLTDGTWTHVAAVFDGTQTGNSNRLKIYVNGNQAPITFTGTIPASTVATTSNVRIGSASDGAATRFFNGNIDEVKIYNSALTVDQIRIDMNANSSLSFSVLGASESADLAGGDGAGPVLEWNFNEQTGQSANDISGNNLAGTLGATSSVNSDDPTWIPVAGAPQNANGLAGSSLSFDGSDYVFVADSATLEPAAMSISVWVKRTGGLGTRQIWLGKGDGAADSSTQYWLEFNTSNQLIFYLSVGSVGKTLTATDKTITDMTTWHHIEATWDGATMKLYLDGKPSTVTTAASGTMTNTAVQFSAGTFGTWGSNLLIGYLDDVKIYNYGRTAAQVAYDYNRGAPVGFWRLDECQGSTANDSSGNGNHGTITIGATGGNTSAGTCAGSAGEAWKDGATGKYNASLDFDGTDDYVNLGSSSTYKFTTGAFTLAAWIKPTNTSSRSIISNDDHSVTGYSMVLSGGKLRFITRGTTDNVTDSVRSISTGIWTHVAVVYTGTAGQRLLYINGNLDTSESFTGSISSAVNNLFIGQLSDDSFLYSGQIDDARVYNYTLSAAQMRKLFNEGSAVRYGVNN